MQANPTTRHLLQTLTTHFAFSAISMQSVITMLVPGDNYHDFAMATSHFFVMDTWRHRGGPFNGEAAEHSMRMDWQGK